MRSCSRRSPTCEYLEGVVGEGDDVAVRSLVNGTHDGDSLDPGEDGQSPSGA